jgi:hypothetical protein
MPSSGLSRRVALVSTDISNEPTISLQRASVASYGYFSSSSILVTLMMEALSSSETLVLTRVSRRNIPVTAVKTLNLTQDRYLQEE